MKNLGKSIAFINDKGGVSKSTSAICYASYLMNQGHKVALVDVDARHTALDWAAVADKAGRKTPLMVGNPNANVGSEIKKLAEVYDYVVVDGMSSFVCLGKKEVIGSIISSVDYILIPTEPNAFDTWAIPELSDLIKARQAIAYGQPKTAIYGARVRENTTLWREFREEDSMKNSPFPILDSFLPMDIEFPRTTSRGATPFDLPTVHKAHIALKKWASCIEDYLNE